MLRDPAIAAVTEIPPGRYPDHSPGDMHRVVLQAFLAQWDLDPTMVDGLLVAPPGLAGVGDGGPDIYVHEALVDMLGIRPRFAETLNLGGATYATMAQRAAWAVRSGLADAVLCVGAGKFPRVRGGGGDVMARFITDPSYEYPYGAWIAPIYALVAQRHMHERGTSRADLAEVAVTARRWALLHPDALQREAGPITAEDVLASRPIAEPFRLLDCSVPCEGGGAFLVTTETLARRINDQPAFIAGGGEFHDHGRAFRATDFAQMGAAHSMRQALQAAGVRPSDVTQAQLYDAFTINPILLCEAAGLAEPGRGGGLFREGRAGPGGDLPVNTYGGLLSFGHTGDASGISMVVEAALQVMGRAGHRQCAADVVLVHTYGGMMADHCSLVLTRRP